MSNCPCGSNLPFADCCEPAIKGARPAQTAEQLMRSRYSAYVTVDTDYIFETTHPKHRQGYDHKGTREWAESAQWENLEIVATKGGREDDSTGEVEFRASYRDKGGRKVHHELASFEKDGEKWYFVDGNLVAPKPLVRSEPKVGRNDPCPCGSGAKFKKCCGK